MRDARGDNAHRFIERGTAEWEERRRSTSEAPRQWWDALGSPDRPDALDALVRHYQWLVASVAWKFKSTLPSYIKDDDLTSYGQLGLLRAIERYDPEVGPFRRFASAYIYGAILDELRTQDWAPRGLRRDQRMVRQATARLRATEENPSVATVAASLGWDSARLESTIQRVANSHHQTLDGTDEIEVVEEPEVLDGVIQSDRLCQVFVETFDALDETAQWILVRVYFLHETLTTVAQETSLPLTVVRRIHTDTVIRLYDTVRLAAG